MSPDCVSHPGASPDVIVGDIQDTGRYGVVGDITAFAIGTTSCNIGGCFLNWLANPNNDHPVIGQNMYRLKDGRFEQIGQSWLKHASAALQGSTCGTCSRAGSGSYLGVVCSDPYSSGLNGSQGSLGPKSAVNASTGDFPANTNNTTGNAIYKRLQVHTSDLDPALNPSSSYFVEAQYVTWDDAATSNHSNNASYRPVNVSTISAGNFTIALTGTTQRQHPGIDAWKAADPTVSQQTISAPSVGRVGSDGVLILSAKATLLGGSIYHYEYALQNLNFDRSISSFRVPIPSGAVVTNIGFHDVDYHSGEPYDGADWTANVAGGAITWSTTPYATNPNANALRWGTLYNFRFDANIPPATDTISLGIFKPGIITSFTVSTVTPNRCNSNGVCEPGENCTNCAADCAGQGGGAGCCGNGTCEAGENPCRCAADCGVQHASEFPCAGGVDEDCDGLVDCADPDCCTDGACAGQDPDGDGYAVCDCDNANASVWATPGETPGVHISKTDASGAIVIEWDPPAAPGGSVTSYNVLRSTSSSDFMTSATCLFMPDPTAHQANDPANPGPGNDVSYLVRAMNACPNGTGSLGKASNGNPRVGRSCP